MFLISLKLLSETSLLLERTQGNVVIVLVRTWHRVPIFLSYFQQFREEF